MKPQPIGLLLPYRQLPGRQCPYRIGNSIPLKIHCTALPFLGGMISALGMGVKIVNGLRRLIQLEEKAFIPSCRAEKDDAHYEGW
jgi:hypothetical protein